MFYSVSGKDIEFAESAWEAFPSDWVYLYSKTGRLGANMWDEIGLQELPKARVFVVFWSRNYPSSVGCVREIEQAASLYRLGLVKPVIARLDDYPISWRDGMDEALKPVFEALRPLADYRASEANASVQKAVSLISSVAEPLLQSDHPRMQRDTLVRALRKSLQRDRFTLQPACWVSGFNGVGREGLVSDLNRNLTPNGAAIVIEINEATLPRQLLLRIESEAFGANLETLQAILQGTAEGDTAAVATAIERIYQAGNYLILRHGRIIQEEVELPEWLDDVSLALSPATRPKLFVLSQQPLSGTRLIKCSEKMVAFRVPTMGEEEMTNFCYELVGYFDTNPSRWSDEDVKRVALAANGTVGFLVGIVRSAARIDSFDNVEAMLAQRGDRMAESITAFVRWAFAQLRDDLNAQKTLLFLNDVTPCHIVDIEKAVTPSVSIIRVLSRLLNLGLVERETDDIYRLTPLLASRLNRQLIRPELVQWAAGAQKAFAASPFEMTTVSDEGNHEYIRLEARVNAALLSGVDSLPNSLGAFVSAAHWFQAGIRLYHARKWQPAYRLLKKAHDSRAEFRDASKVEIDRYFCLTATRMRKYSEAEACITRLEADHRSKPIAAFLAADLHEYQRNFPEAIKAYERAISLNRDKNRRLEYIYRPLVRCILASWKPDFEKAERYAKIYVGLKRTVFSLSALANVYLEWKFRRDKSNDPVPDNIDSLFENALGDLERHPGADAAPFEIYAKEAEFTGDFPAAIESMDQAIRLDPERFQLKAERWRMMASFGESVAAAQAVRELDEARGQPSNEAIWPSYVNALTETYVRALLSSGQPVALANGFAPELQASGELGQIIARVRRN
ncbi:tetratricopeptide repeat protein [Tabrizicola sp.]|uniref:tetratricopeptide repeat protein n=1 Tax=Tabrizicola sp. TaxID=2005166 RepID=UPI0035AFCB28